MRQKPRFQFPLALLIDTVLIDTVLVLGLVLVLVVGLGCNDTVPTLLETERASPIADGQPRQGDDDSSEWETDDASPKDSSDDSARSGSPDATPDMPPDEPARPGPGSDSKQGDGPPATTKSQMSYIFVAHPDDEMAAWSTIENSSGNYHVFVVLTRGGHTGYCENPASKPGMDQYPPAPRDSEACKENRIESWHKFLNRAAATDPFLDVLPADSPDVSDVDASAGRFDVWVGAKSARVVFDFPDGGLQSQNLVTANELVRSMKGSLLPDLPDFQAMAASFWNANYPNCRRYDHPDHRAVHVGVYQNDLDTQVQRGRTCATDPDAVYFRQVSANNWRTLAGSPDFLENGGDPGIFRQSYGWLRDEWEMSEDESMHFSRQQSFWQRGF
jgi:LmbE family N-acetylglucosaminyl deacetylase